MTVAAPAAISVVVYTLLLTWMESFFHLSFDTTSTMVDMLIGTISLNVLLVVARPFNRLKTGLLASLSVALFLVFFVFNGIFHSPTYGIGS